MECYIKIREHSFLSAIWLLVLFVLDGDAGENEYGLNPKEITPIEGR
jgi:uncharacterized membrane protein YhaH (DUF805 family)